MLPEALASADATITAFEKQAQLSPQWHNDALTDLLRLIKTPTDSLQASFANKTDPNFCARILAAVNFRQDRPTR